MAAHMQEKEGTAAALEDAAASIEARRAGEALVELETEGVAYGDVALSVAVRGTAEHLEQWGADIQRGLRRAGRQDGAGVLRAARGLVRAAAGTTGVAAAKAGLRLGGRHGVSCAAVRSAAR